MSKETILSKKLNFVYPGEVSGDLTKDADVTVGEDGGYEALVDPTANENAEDGIKVRATWLNKTTGNLFVCLDNTVGAAVWGQLVLSEGVLTVADASERKTAESYTGTMVGATRVVQGDMPGILWSLVAADVTVDASWIGMPYTVDPDGDVVVNMQLASVAGTVPDAHVLGRVGNIPTVGDGATTGGVFLQRSPTEASLARITDGTVFPIGDARFSKNKFVGGRLLLGETSPAPGPWIVPYLPYPCVIDFDWIVPHAGVTEVWLPESVVELADLIGTGLFKGRTSLTKINFPGSIDSVSARCCDACTGLLDAMLGEGITRLRMACFQGTSSLASVVLPSTLVTIDSQCFASGGLTSIVIPASVTSIGQFSFASCPLATIHCLAMEAPSYDLNPFVSTGATEIHVPVGATGYGTTWADLTVVYDL